MKPPIAIEKLSLSEKVELMEALWKDMSASSEYQPPRWHAEEIEGRRNAVKEGRVSYTDWQKAKEEIRNELL